MTKQEFNIQIGILVKEKRESKNWSQSDLADKMGNNFQNISRLERGEISPTFYWMNELSNVFDQPYSEFVKEFETRLGI